MASIAKRPNGQWRARYRDATGREHARHFPRKLDAERWLRGQQTRLDQGDWVSPDRGRMLFGEFSGAWLNRQQHLKPSTRARYESILNVHLLPRWGRAPLARITYEDVSHFVSGLTGAGASPSTVRQTHRVLALILAEAVKSSRIARNPAEGVSLPRVVKGERRFLTAQDVTRLADATSGQDRLVIMLLAFTGLRFGEAAAVRVGRIDLMRRRLEISESVSEVSGQLVWGSPKTHQRRTVPIPRFLIDDLAERIAGKGPDELAFTAPGGGPLRLMNWRRRTFDPAARAAGLAGVTPHALRHTAASLAVASGATVKDVQAMLGHASAAMTLDVYAGLFTDGLDAVADRMDAVARAAADSLRTGAVVTPLPSTAGAVEKAV